MSQTPVQRAVPFIVLTAIGALVVASMTLPTMLLFSHVPRQFNEGWNAYLADRAMMGMNIYPGEELLIFNHYPPLSFYIVGIFGTVTGDNVIAGRIVSTIGLAVIAFNIMVISYRMGVGRVFSIFAALLFLLFMVSEGIQYIIANDPQLLAHAWQTTGLVILLGQSNRQLTILRLGVGLLAIFIGCMTKHNLVPLPVALTLAFLVHDRRLFLVWVGLGATVAAIAIAACLMAFGTNVVSDTLMHPRIVTASRAYAKSRDWILPIVPFVLFALAALMPDRRSLSATIVIFYVILSFAAAVVFSAGDGVFINAVFDLVIATSIGTGLFAKKLADRLPARLPSTATALVVLALPMASHVPAAIRGQQRLLAMTRSQDGWSKVISVLAEKQGPVACETLALCYWAGKEFQFEFFSAGQAIKLGRMPTEALLRPIETQRYAAIQIGDPNHKFGAVTSLRLPTIVNDAIGRHYEPIISMPLMVAVPAR